MIQVVRSGFPYELLMNKKHENKAKRNVGADKGFQELLDSEISKLKEKEK